MTRLGVKVEVIDRFEVGDLSQGIGSERRLSVKGVKDDTLEQVAESHVLELREGLQHLQYAPLHPDSGLNAFDFQVSGCPRHISSLMRRCYLGTKITWYISRDKCGQAAPNDGILVDHSIRVKHASYARNLYLDG